MHDIPNRIADVLLEVEASLRQSGRWDTNRPSDDALRSRELAAARDLLTEMGARDRAERIARVVPA